ncbi:MAG: hypothetical protein ACKO0V_21255 [bacterium]
MTVSEKMNLPFPDIDSMLNFNGIGSTQAATTQDIPSLPAKPAGVAVKAPKIEAPVPFPTSKIEAPVPFDLPKPAGQAKPASAGNHSIVVLKRSDNAVQKTSVVSPESILLDPGVELAGCTRCGQLGDPGSLDFGYCATGRCTPGRAMCYPYVGDSLFQRISSLVYQCLSCPDPCYEATWNPLANAAIMDNPRPQTMMRIRYDRFSNITTPDRAGYFWAQANGKGLGPKPLRLSQSTPVKRPLVQQPIFVNFDEGSYSMEAGAAGKMSFFMTFPYRNFNSNETYKGASGFGDMSLGTKSVIFDSELFLMTFQFKTYIPIGSATNGLGLGTVRFEPSLLMALKLSETSYIQGQVGEWIPLSAGSNYFGSILQTKFSWNQQLSEIIPNVPLIGFVELDTWSFQGGRYTELYYTQNKQLRTISMPANSQTYLNLGPGMRIAFGNKIDVGTAVLMGLGPASWGNPIFTFDLRWMY